MDKAVEGLARERALLRTTAGRAYIETDGLNDELDAAYRAKYGHYTGPTARITSREARAATLRLVAR